MVISILRMLRFSESCSNDPLDIANGGQQTLNSAAPAELEMDGAALKLRGLLELLDGQFLN
jgi:hypothetical protein